MEKEAAEQGLHFLDRYQPVIGFSQ
jgi:hypothetical protein